MSERDYRSGSEPEPSISDLIESAVRKIVTAMVIAGGLIGLGLWSRSPPKTVLYQMVAAEGRIYRVNTRTGTIVGCQGDRCAIVLHHDQDFEDSLPAPPPQRQIAPPPQGAPAPAPAAAPAAAPPPPAAPAPAPATH